MVTAGCSRCVLDELNLHSKYISKPERTGRSSLELLQVICVCVAGQGDFDTDLDRTFGPNLARKAVGDDRLWLTARIPGFSEFNLIVFQTSSVYNVSASSTFMRFPCERC